MNSVVAINGKLAKLNLAPSEPEAAAVLVQADIYDKLPNWPLHRADLRLDLVAQQTRLQSWNLAPARADSLRFDTPFDSIVARDQWQASSAARQVKPDSQPHAGMHGCRQLMVVGH